MITRRNFLQLSLGGMGLVLSPFTPTLATGNISGKKIINILLHGGNDTANAFPPYPESNYYTLRPTIAISENDAVKPNNMTALGLHPSYAPFQSIIEAGDMAIFPATHCGPNPNRSHFYQFDFYDRGGYTTNTSLDSKGFLARYLNAKYNTSNGIEAFDFYGSGKMFNASNIPVLNNSNPESLVLGPNQSIAKSIITNLKNNSHISTLASSYQETQDVLFDRLNTLENVDFTANTSSYPSSTLGRQLKQSATMFRNLPELETVQLVKGSWDTHGNQGGATGNHANLLKDVADSIKAFYDDLGSDMDKVAIVVRQEFGRTAKENGSKGTDHGHASGWFVVSKDLSRGGMVGTWPGFGTSDLAQGRYTAQTTDYRDIYAEVFKWAGMSNPEQAFPDYSYNELGFLNHA